MRKLLAATFVALLMVGCGGDTKKPAGDSLESNQSSAEIPPDKTAEVAKVVVDYEKLEERDDLHYFEEKPFTGVAVKKYDNVQKEFEVTFKDGKMHGLGTSWYENGQKRVEHTYKDGKEDGLWTRWYENGQKRGEATFKDGEVISEKEWDEDGNPL